MNIKGVDVPTLVPSTLAPRPATATLPITWQQKLRQPGFWLVGLATVLAGVVAFVPLSIQVKGFLVAILAAMGKYGIESALEFSPTRVAWSEEQKWAQSYRNVYAGQPPLRGYVPGMPDDPYRKKSPTATTGTLFDGFARIEDIRDPADVPTMNERPSTRPTTAVPVATTPEGDIVPGSKFNPEVKP